MDNKNENLYFAAKEAQDAQEIILRKADMWFKGLDNNGYLDKLRTMWAAYHGNFYDSYEGGHRVSFGGEQGELVNIAVNHLRNVARHMLTMVTSVRPSLQARATNTDYKSLVQTKLANGLLDYYMREKRLEEYVKLAVEYAIVLGSGFIKMEWNATSGEVYDFNEELGIEEKEGDIEFTNLSPFDVIFDINREDNKHDWVLARTFKNRYDLAAKYPEHADDILALPTKDQLENYYVDSFGLNDTELIPVYEFFHKKTESMPEGRYLLFLSRELNLLDSPLPYRALPIYRIAPANILGTPYGYTDMFDVLPLQDAVNTLYSTVLTNQAAFGVQSVIVPKDADVVLSELSSGMNLIEANERNGQIRPLQLTASPKEVFDSIAMYEKAIETISGVNSVSRGNPDPQLRSGNALALVQSMTMQFISGLQQSYVFLLEDIGTGLINQLKDFASVPRIAMISGKSNRSFMKEFTGDDLSSVNRVIVDIGNPMARCFSKGTEVLMFDGSKKKVEDITVGELIMGPDSKFRTVFDITSGNEMMYEVTSKDSNRKIKYGCNESHILTLKYCSDDERYNVKKGQIIDLTIKEYLELPERHQRLLQGFKVGVEFSKKEIPIPAYILGSWLGDGNSANPGITTMDAEVFKEWFDYSESIGMQLRTCSSTLNNKAKTYYITSGQSHGKSDRNPMMNELRAMELINNKHIPNIYLTSSREDRLELLAGLIDTDGSRTGETFIFTQKCNILSSQVIFLAESLGFRVTCKKIPSDCGPTSDGSPRYIMGETNKIVIGGNTWEIPTRIIRKKTSPKSKSRDWLNYGIKVETVGEGTYYGFSLKEEPHFLLGDFTVTHNSVAGKVEMAEQMLQMGLITTPQQYLMVIETGKLEVMTDDVVNPEYVIKSENERLVSGEPVVAVFTDNHAMHIKEHAAVLADPELRFDQELVKRVDAHMQEHLNLLRTTDPQTLQMLGQQPLGPIGGSPTNQAPPQMPPDASMQGQVPAMQGGPTVDQQMGVMPDPNIPQPAQPPMINGVPQPSTPEQMLAMNTMGGQ